MNFIVQHIKRKFSIGIISIKQTGTISSEIAIGTSFKPAVRCIDVEPHSGCVSNSQS
jgi:hypothetical protein